MDIRSIKSWRDFFIAATVVAVLQMAVIQPSAEAAVDILSIKSPVASITTLPVELGTTAAGGACEGCDMPSPLRDRVTDLVVTTSLSDGGYVAVWQNKFDNIVYGQCFSRENQARSGVFHINAEVADGILPVILVQRDGGFVASWQQAGQRYEQHFNPRGMPLGNAARLE